jgi:hypothetical protein
MLVAAQVAGAVASALIGIWWGSGLVWDGWLRGGRASWPSWNQPHVYPAWVGVPIGVLAITSIWFIGPFADLIVVFVGICLGALISALRPNPERGSA